MLEHIYNFSLPLLALLLRVGAIFSTRLREFLTAREGLLQRWESALAKIPAKNRLWFHVSSVGELEQIRPVLERLSKKNNYTFLLSYYSPSVPRLVKDWSFVAYADYLPLDFYRETKVLTKMIHPQMLVLNRYDLWPNLLKCAREEKIPVALLNASTPPLGLWGLFSLWARKPMFQAIYLWTYVDSVAAAAWEPYRQKGGYGLVTGNPRVDRALLRVEEAMRLGKIKDILARWEHEKSRCIVAGSTWEKDEEILLAALLQLRKVASYEGTKMILVPHEPNAEHIRGLEKKCQSLGLSFSKYSALSTSTEKFSSDILLVDVRGVLAEIYGQGAVAYVGGGFGKEVHSIIEPLAHRLPVAYGPKHERSPEAKTVAIMQGAFVVRGLRDASALADWWQDILADGEKAHRAKEALRIYLQIHRGAGERVGDFLAERIKIQ